MLPVYNPSDHIPPPHNLFPGLKLVRDKVGIFRAYISAELAQALNLSAGQPIDLRRNGADTRYWNLDLRPSAPNKLNWYRDTRPRIQRLCLPDHVVDASGVLRLCLVPGSPPSPDYYLMMPDAYFAPKQAPPLAA